MVASADRYRSGLAAALATTLVVFAMTVRDAGGISVGPPAAEVVSELTVKADVAAKGLMHELAKQARVAELTAQTTTNSEDGATSASSGNAQSSQEGLQTAPLEWHAPSVAPSAAPTSAPTSESLDHHACGMV